MYPIAACLLTHLNKQNVVNVRGSDHSAALYRFYFIIIYYCFPSIVWIPRTKTKLQTKTGYVKATRLQFVLGDRFGEGIEDSDRIAALN